MDTFFFIRQSQLINIEKNEKIRKKIIIFVTPNKITDPGNAKNE